MRRSLSLLPFALLLAAIVACGRIQIPQCVLDGSCLPRLATPTAAATEPPRAAPTAAVTATATATSTSTATSTAAPALPTPTARATPFPTVRPTVANTCVQAPSIYNPTIRRAISLYQSRNPTQFDGNFLLYKDSVSGEPITQDQFIWGVCSILGQISQLDCIEDPCLCGDMAVADSATPQGSGFSEQYHLISSQRMVLQQPYLERCTPRWF